MDEQQTQQPIEELFPQVMRGWPPEKQWAELEAGSRSSAMEPVMHSELGLKIKRGGRAPNLSAEKRAELLEWSLRHGRPHPELPVTKWVPYEPGSDLEVTVD